MPTNKPPYSFTPTVDGDDILVLGARATWFGGANDPQDNGETASGVNTKQQHSIMGCALPMQGFRVTRESPLPKIPWYTPVHVWQGDESSGTACDVNLIDLGPSPYPAADADIDLTVTAFQKFASLKTGKITVNYRILGAAKYMPK